MSILLNTVRSETLARKIVPTLFTLTIFLSASLLFFVQPLFTKIVLPYIGGAPAVWTTAMLFFQTVLIAGYLYAHLSTKYLPVIAQVGLHLALWVIALMFLPLSISDSWSYQADGPIAVQTLTLFALGVGMPFAVLSANAPLIQSWYSKSDGPSADDPYFLYGASNLGSLSALLAFPLFAEPLFGANQIGWGWTAGFILMGVFLALSGTAAWKGKRRPTAAAMPAKSAARPTLKTYGLWLFLAFIPSSLMLSVTTKISTDVGSFPLIWVLPLALYLLTFVLTFTNKPLIGKEMLRWSLIISVAFFAIVLSGLDVGIVTIPLIALLLLAFFAIAMCAHQTLYDARPDQSNLTIFYVTMSVGGALGGLFNSIIAPSIFVDIHEARITVFLAATLIFVGSTGLTVKKVTRGILLGALIALPVTLSSVVGHFLEVETLVAIMLVLYFIVLILGNRNVPTTFITTATVLIFGGILSQSDAHFKDRSFFGSHIVVDRDQVRLYQNGTTIHGAQLLSEFESDVRPTPLFYYHPDGPLAQVMTSDFAENSTDIGVVGLGVGALSCFSTDKQKWQFYEIDVLVDQVARDSSLFTFMSTCAPDAPTHLGDARIVLEQQNELKYDILIIDAYSSDAVPIHLTTNEAIALYKERLKPGGILMLHISNRYYEISLPLGRSAEDLGMSAREQYYQGDSQEVGNVPSNVVIMSEDESSLAEFDKNPSWVPLESDGKRIWTDDFANLLSILN